MTLTADFVTGRNLAFLRMRRLLSSMALQSGAMGAADFDVTQRAAGGANMSVDVAAGEAWILVTTGGVGLVHARSDAIENRAIAASNATNPRVDSIVLQYNDSSIPAGVGGDDPTIRVITGTATPGATLDNRSGAPGGAGGPVMPADTLLLGDVLVPAASTSVINGNIRDRRRWARGAHAFAQRTAGNLQISSAVFAPVSDADFQKRVECSGAPLVCELHANLSMNNVNVNGFTRMKLDGVALPETQRVISFALNYNHVLVISYPLIPAAGSRLIGWEWSNNSNTLTMSATATGAAWVRYYELNRQNVSND